MRSPAAAIAWELLRRHRWGAAAVGVYLVALAAIRVLLFDPAWRAFYDNEARFALVVIVPVGSTFMYLLGVFSFGFAGDLAAKESIFPARMGTMPVTSAALAGWPMLYGAVAMVALWGATRALAVWPEGLDVPLVWPALASVVYLGWTQALAWMPYRFRGVRVIAIVLWLGTIGVGGTVALELRVAEPVMLALLVPHLPLAYLTARWGVARARRGEMPDRSGVPARLAGASEWLPRRRGYFSSAARAQAWFEWRRHGRSLPLLLALLLPFELALLFVFRDIPLLVLETLVLVLLTPPFLAAFVAATVSKSSPGGSDAYELTPFLVTRPLSSVALVAAKLKATARSTLAAWALVLITTALAVMLSGTSPVLVERARQLAEAAGTPRAVVIAVLGLALLMMTTWKQLVRGLYIGLSGRAGLVKASVFVTLALVAVILPFLPWVSRSADVIMMLWRVLPWILGALVCLKVCAAAWVVGRLHDRRLVRDRALVTGAAGWVAAVLALYAVLAWLLAMPPSVPRTLPALAAILSVPLARLAAAPLAVARNRHRGRRGRKRSAVAASDTSRGRAGRVVGAALTLIALPVVLVFADAVTFDLRNRPNGSIVSSGEEREYLLYVPDSYDAGTPTPLVISMHGGASWPAQQMHLSRWNRLADENGFLVVYPSGAGYPRVWHTFESEPALRRDVRFVSDLIDRLQSGYNIDPARIYANGMSNGGGMAFVLSCTLSGRIAAVGMVAPAQTLPPAWCASTRPVAVIAFHGAADPIVRYHGGPMGGPSTPARPMFVAAREFIALWAQRNRCAPDAIESAVAADVSRLAYSGCAEDAAVTLFTIHGGGHTWPGGEPLPQWFAGPTSNGVDATREMWAFFLEHPLRR